MSEISSSKHSPEEETTGFSISPETEQALLQLTSQLDIYQNELVNSFSISPEIEDALLELSLLLDIYDGTFTLLLARCNYANLCDRAISRLTEILPTGIREVRLDKTTKSIYHAIQSSTPPMRQGNLPAVMVKGLETTDNVDVLVKGLNQIREEFRKNCLFPIVIWINDDLLKRLIKIAPDFESWTTTIEFTIASEDLIGALTSGTEALFHLALSANLIDPSHSLGRVSHLGGIYISELNIAIRDLKQQGRQIAPSLQAGLDFIRGMNTRDLTQSLAYLQASYKYWESVQNIERQGLLLYQIGRRRYHLTKLEKHSHDENWHVVQQFFERSLASFERCNRQDLMAQCYLQLQRTLHHLNAWTELKQISHQAIEVHKILGDGYNLAADYGFLARVALEEAEWETAQKNAERAIALLVDAPKTLQWLNGLYLGYLAQAQIQLGNQNEALTNLLDAKGRKHCGHPQMYIRILNELRDLYFSQGKYLEAFQTKQERLEIEQRYGYRAFIGAGQLQSSLEEHSSFVDRGNKFIISPEIFASGRKQDLDELTKRIGEPRYKMIVLHGNSGVGKSSFVNAGLMPALQQSSFGGKDVLPISIRVYTNWEQELLHHLVNALQSLQFDSFPVLRFKKNENKSSKEDLIPILLEQLRWNESSNLRTVLIFDQFEEFFFVHQHQFKERQRFFEFIGSLLNDFQYLSSIKVVLSLREDYIHYLLECNRVKSMSAIDNDILSKNVLYPLGNFSAAAAHSTIKALTERAQFYLEPQLIDILVKDLTNECDEIRPIELQIVGAQLQHDRISSIQQYQKLGANPKEMLVQRYLDNVVCDCGQENYRLANLILYLLTDEKGTRPLKTYAELERSLHHLNNEVQKQSKSENEFDKSLFEKNDQSIYKEIESTQIELVIKILVGSGLVVLIPENPTDRCQLVHDYLAVVIRKSQAPEIQKLQQELEKTQDELRQTVRQLEGSLKNSQAITDSLELNSLLDGNLVELDELRKTMNKAQQWLTDIDAIASENRLQLSSTIYRAIYEIKEKVRIQGHLNGAWCVEVSPDSSTIVTGGLDNLIKLWQIDGREIKQLAGHSAPIRSVSFSPNGQTILSSSSDKTLSLWNLNGDRLNTFIGHTAAVWSARFSHNGKMIVSGSADQSIKLWDLNGNEINTFIGHHGDVRAVLFSPDDKWIISGGADKTIMIWGIDGTILQTIKGHTADIRSISINHKGTLLASGSGDNILKLWRINQRKQTSQSTESDPESNEICINEIEEVFSMQGHSSAIRNVSFSPEGTMLATGSADKKIKLWDLNGIELQVFKGHSDAVRSICFSPNGQTLISASLDCTIRQWHINRRSQKELHGHSAAVRSVTYSPDGKRIASGSLDDQIKIWDRKGNELQTIVGSSDILCVKFSPDGNNLLVGSGDSTIYLWPITGSDRLPLQVFTGHSTAVWSVDFSADGQRLISGSSDKSVKLWQIDGTEIASFIGHKSTVWTVGFSPDSQKIVSGSGDDTIKLWSVDGSELLTLKGHQAAVWSVCFSPDGQWILSSSGDSTIKLWDLEGKLLQTFRGHDATVWSARFSPDGRSIISGSADNTIKLWSIEGRQLQTLSCPNSTPLSLCFRPDGRGFVSGHGSNVVSLWNLNLSDLFAQGCEYLHN